MRLILIALASLLAVACNRLPASTAPDDLPTAASNPDQSVGSTEGPPPTEWTIRSIDWDDADSGDINGVRFRLYSVDAPETGGVGAAVGAAECELERERGLRAKAWMVEHTPPASLRITATHGFDRMDEPRLLVDLAAGGLDVGQAGIAAGVLKPWPHRGSTRLVDKPDWCRP